MNRHHHKSKQGGGGRVMMNYRQYLIPDSVKFNCAEAGIRNLKVAAFQE